MTPPAIIRACESAWRIPRGSIIGPKLTADHCQARFAAALILRNDGMSWWAIADELNRRSHTAAINAVGRARVLLTWDRKFGRKYKRALAIIHGQSAK